MSNTNPIEKSVLIGLSGGVDSAAAAFLLKKQGYRVTGAFCAMHSFSQRELQAAERVAETLSIPFVVLDIRKEFESIVIKNFIEEYAQGHTPNPCIVCNPLVKFAALCKAADQSEIINIATGHYAGAGCSPERYFIKKSRIKDQSYMLSRLRQDTIGRLLLPLYNMDKSEIRQMAAQVGISVAEKKDSQDICFLGGGNYADFLEASMGGTTGDMINADTGEIVGKHEGIFRYTIGQRKNLGVALGKPIFVKSIDPQKNIVYLSATYPVSQHAQVRDIVWQCRTFDPGESFVASIKTRFGARDERGFITVAENGRASIAFESAARAVTPGQTAVFYDNDAIIGSGFIEADLTDNL